MSKQALLIIDLQNCCIKEGNSYLPAKVREHIVSHSYDYILFSRFVNTYDSNFMRKRKWDNCFSKQGTAIVPELKEFIKEDNVFSRNTFSAFKAKGLIEYLQRHNIKKIYLSGLNLHACVLATLFEAFDLGYDYELLTDITDIHDNQTSQRAIDVIKKNLF